MFGHYYPNRIYAYDLWGIFLLYTRAFSPCGGLPFLFEKQLAKTYCTWINSGRGARLLTTAIYYTIRSMNPPNHLLWCSEIRKLWDSALCFRLIFFWVLTFLWGIIKKILYFTILFLKFKWSNSTHIFLVCIKSKQ